MSRRQQTGQTIWIAISGGRQFVLHLPPTRHLMIATAVVLGAAAFGSIGYSSYQDQAARQKQYDQQQLIAQKEKEISALKSENEALTRKVNVSKELYAGKMDKVNEHYAQTLSRVEQLSAELEALKTQAKKISIRPTSYRASSSQPKGGSGEVLGLAELQQRLDRELNDLEKNLEGSKHLVAARVEIVTQQQARQRAQILARPSGYPLAGYYRASSLFGYRKSPFGWRYEMHDGLDFPAPYGTPVYSTASGVVASTAYSPIFGRNVIVDHGNGYRTLYGHLSRIQVQTGQTLTDGQMLGRVGSTGRSTGAHLHYTVKLNNVSVNPKPYL